LTRNLNLLLYVSNAYGDNSCSIKICAPSQNNALYRVWNTAGAQYRFRRPDGSCVLRANNAEITSAAATTQLGPGQIITRHANTDTTCSTPLATLTYNQAVCEDDDADRLINWGATGPTDR